MTNHEDVNERVRAEWVEETTSAERVRSILRHTTDPQSASTIANRARTSESTARKHARGLVSEGFAVEIGDPNANGVRYKRSEESLVMEEANRIRHSVDDATLSTRISKMQEELRNYREKYGAESPEDALLSDADIGSEELQAWQTTRRNLNFAKVAVALNEAVDTISDWENTESWVDLGQESLPERNDDDDLGMPSMDEHLNENQDADEL